MVSVLVITVAPFQWRHNARCTTLERLERWSIQFKLSTLKRSESQSEKGSVTVRVDGDTRQRSTSDASPVLGSLLLPNDWQTRNSASGVRSRVSAEV
jgi:hypothetical protein